MNMGRSNDYTKEEDYMMWELHEIRKKIAAQNLSAEEINRRGQEALARFRARKKKELQEKST